MCLLYPFDVVITKAADTILRFCKTDIGHAGVATAATRNSSEANKGICVNKYN